MARAARAATARAPGWSRVRLESVGQLGVTLSQESAKTNGPLTDRCRPRPRPRRTRQDGPGWAGPDLRPRSKADSGRPLINECRRSVGDSEAVPGPRPAAARAHAGHATRAL